MAPESKSSISSNRADYPLSKENKRFSTVLMATIVALVTISVVVVLVVLNSFLGERVEKEFRNKLDAQKGQIEILLQNRISEIRKLLEDISSDNSIRVTMMLDVTQKLTELIVQSYPPQNGVYPFIQKTGIQSVFPESYNGLARNLIQQAFNTRPRGEVLQNGSTPHLLWFFTKTIMGNEEIMGSTSVVYDMVEDSGLKNKIQEALSGDIVLWYADALWSLATGNRIKLDSDRVDVVRQNSRGFEFVGDLAFSRVLSNRSLYFVSSSKELQGEQKKVALLMAAISALALGFSVLISMFLAGKMVRPLKEMTRKAIQISKGDETRPTFEKSSPYWEFNQLSQAFNTMLANLKDAEERSRYQELLENVDDAVYIFDNQGFILEANTAAYTALGYTKEQFCGLGIDAIVPETVIQTTMNQDTGVSHNPPFENLILETRHFKKDGGFIPVEIYSHPITYMGKSVILNVARDITERIEAEREKKQLEAQLIHAQKMEAMGTMAGCIAHDFNNLILAIQGRVEMLRRHVKPGHPDSQHLENIKEAVGSARKLTRQLLGFARKDKSETEPVDINLLVEESTHMFISSRNKIELHLDFTKDIWPVMADRGQLEQVLVNMYVNAWQAMQEEGNLEIHTVNVYLEDDFCKPFGVPGGRYVNIRISDTGVGIKQEIIDNIFDPFFTTKKAEKGTGLGLASAYGIIRNHKGIITVKSEPGQGTTFNIYLPSSRAADQNGIQQTGSF